MISTDNQSICIVQNVDLTALCEVALDGDGRMLAIEHYCATRGLTGKARLAERLTPGNTADIMKRIEERLETFRKSDFAGCGQMLKKALKYAVGEWPAVKRILECGEVELSNNLSEQMMRRIKMNLKNACNIGGEITAKHNAFMFSVIESCKMIKAKCGRLSESSFPPTANIERRRRLDVLLAMLYVFLV